MMWQYDSLIQIFLTELQFKKGNVGMHVSKVDQNSNFTTLPNTLHIKNPIRIRNHYYFNIHYLHSYTTQQTNFETKE